MARDYIIIHVNIFNETEFKDFFKYTKNYDDEGLKMLMFPEGVVNSVEILRPESEN